MKKVMHLLPIQPAVQQVSLNIEKAIWKSLRSFLPTVKLEGCVSWTWPCGGRLVHIKASY